MHWAGRKTLVHILTGRTPVIFLRGIYERIKYIIIMVRQRLIIKIEHKTLSKTELTFFENERTLKKKYIKPVMDKEMK